MEREEFPEFLEELAESSEEEKEKQETLSNIREKETVDLSEVNIVQGYQVQHRMTLEFIQRGRKSFCDFPDRIKAVLREKIASDKPIDYYVGIIDANRMTFEYLAPSVGPGLFMDPMSQINCRVFYVVHSRSLTQQQHFIDSINREK